MQSCAEMQLAAGRSKNFNRAGGIRTRGLLHPRQALYQAEPQPELIAGKHRQLLRVFRGRWQELSRAESSLEILPGVLAALESALQIIEVALSADELKAHLLGPAIQKQSRAPEFFATKDVGQGDEESFLPLDY